MIKKDINYIERLLNNKKIIDSKLLSNSFGINCLKIRTNDGNNYVVKYYHNKIKKFNAIKAELNNLVFFNKLNLNFFPKVYTKHNDYLIISYFNNNGLQPKNLNRELLLAIIKLHSIKNDKYGFDFNTQIGGLKQINTKCKIGLSFIEMRD